MKVVEPDLELRNAIVSYFWEKGGSERVNKFLFDFQIESIYVYYIKHGDVYKKVMHVKPKFSKNRRKSISINTFNIRRCMGDLGLKDKFELFKSYKEPFPGAWSNDKPWSRKKQKPNKRR